MLKSITIRNLGPYGSDAAPILLDPAGRSDLSSASATGKTTLVAAMSWALWGKMPDGSKFDDAYIHDGADEVSVELTLKSGATFTRTKRRGKSPVRLKNGEVIPTDAAWTTALAALGNDPDLLRVIVCPLAWCELADGPGGGRPLRDLLAALLPSANLRSVVQELCPELRDSDSISEAEAFRNRADWNRRHDELAGSVRTLTAQQIPPDERTAQPDPKDVQRARNVLEAAKAWDAWRPVAAWDERLAALGPRPDVDVEKLAAKHAAVAAAEAKAADLRSIVSNLEHAPLGVEPPQATLTAWNAALDKVRKVEAAGGRCAECDQVIPDALTTLNVAKSEADAADKAHRAAVVAFETTKKKAQAKRTKDLEEARGNLQAVERLTLPAARKELANAEQRTGAWDAAHRALGRRPAGPTTAPEASEPTEAQVQWSRDLEHRLTEAAGARRQAEQQRARLAADLERARKEHEEAKAEAARLDKVVEAIRRAPSIIAERQLGHLGEVKDGRAVIRGCALDTTISIRLPAEGPAVEVLIDGRPYYTASRGKLVVADLALRTAMRRARKLGWLPLCVDNAQDCSGELVTEGPAIVLRTAAVALREVA